MKNLENKFQSINPHCFLTDGEVTQVVDKKKMEEGGAEWRERGDGNEAATDSERQICVNQKMTT